MPKFTAESGCSIYSQCQIANPDCPPIGETFSEYMRQNPLILSEQLCIRALLDHSQSRTEDPNLKIFNEVDLTLDTALAYSRHDKTMAHEQLSKVAGLLDTVDKMPMHELSQRHHRIRHAHMRVLDAFMPAFADRVDGINVSPESAALVHANLCNHLRDFDSNYIHMPPQPSKIKTKHLIAARAEHEVLALMTRPGVNLDYFPFPALAHEEASHHAKLNHDLYVILNGTKVPIQVKLTKQSGRYDDDEVIVISRDKIFDAMRTSEYNRQLDRPDDLYYSANSTPIITVPSITELLLTEQRIGKFDSTSISMLNLASAYIITRINGLSLRRRQKVPATDVA